MLTGENGILNEATKSKEGTELAKLKEQAEIEILGFNIDNTNLVSAETIDKLVEKGVLNSDRSTFTNNNNYKLLRTGDIVYNGTIVERVELTNSISYLEVTPTAVAATIGTRMITCKDGIVEYIKPEDKTRFNVIANPAPAGKKFAFWVDKYDNIVSYNSTQEFLTIDNNTYYAIYVNEDENVTKTHCLNIYSSNKTQDGMLAFQAYFVCNPELTDTYVSSNIGVLATNNVNLSTETDLIVGTTNPEIIFKSHEVFNTLISYSLTKSNAGSDVWYCRAHATITYSDGTTETIYSPNITSIQK